MRKIRSIINIALGSMIAALGLTGCKDTLVMYGSPEPMEKYGCPVDTTVQCMYGVTPVTINELNE